MSTGHATRHEPYLVVPTADPAPLPPRSSERYARKPDDSSPAPSDGEHVRLDDGRTLLLRPIQAADVDAVRRSFHRLDPEEVHMRFMLAMRELPEPMARRLCGIDPECEAAYVLMDPATRPQELRGVGRIHIDTSANHAEFAVLVERAWTGHGLGHLLMSKLIDECRRRGVDELWGHVLTRNNPMLDLCRDLGFRPRPLHDDPGMQLMALRLD